MFAKVFEAAMKPWEAAMKPWEAAMKPWEEMNKKSMEAVKDYEQAANAFFQNLSEAPSQLNLVGQTLKTASTVKEQSDRAMEKVLEAMRVPSSADIERLYERLGDIDARLDDMEVRASKAGAKK